MEFLKNLFKMKSVVLFEKYKNTKNKLNIVLYSSTLFD